MHVTPAVYDRFTERSKAYGRSGGETQDPTESKSQQLGASETASRTRTYQNGREITLDKYMSDDQTCQADDDMNQHKKKSDDTPVREGAVKQAGHQTGIKRGSLVPAAARP